MDHWLPCPASLLLLNSGASETLEAGSWQFILIVLILEVISNKCSEGKRWPATFSTRHTVGVICAKLAGVVHSAALSVQADMFTLSKKLFASITE